MISAASVRSGESVQHDKSRQPATDGVNEDNDEKLDVAGVLVVVMTKLPLWEIARRTD